LANSTVLFTSVLFDPMNSVSPSGLERATYSAAIMPEAPGLFSTMVGMPRLAISSASLRA
jgi:hypothetical protein